MWRKDYSAGLGAPPLFYAAGTVACTLNAGAGDGGSQVPSSDGKCWLAVFPAAGFDPREWGGLCSGAGDDLVALKAVAAYIAINGGRMVLPGFCRISGPLPITSPIEIAGSGPDSSGLIYNATTGDVLNIQTTSAPYIHDLSIAIVGTTWGTAGAGISLNGIGGGGLNNYNLNTVINNVTIRGTWDCVREDNAAGLRTVDLTCLDNGHDGIYKRNLNNVDVAQDSHVNLHVWNNSRGLGTPNASFEYEGGGPVLLTNYRSVGSKYNVLINQKVGPTGTFLIDNSSFEEATVANIGVFQAMVGADMSNLIVTGSVFTNVNAPGGKLLHVGTGTPSGHTKWMTNIQLTGNTDSSFRNLVGGVIQIEDGDAIEISGNIFDNHATAGPTLFDIPAGAINVHLGSNNVPSGSYPTGYYSAATVWPMQSGPWLGYTPTVGCGAGAFGTLGAHSGSWISDGKSFSVQLTATITLNGTCASFNTFTLPFTAKTSCDITGRESAVSGAIIGGHITAGSNVVSVSNYANVYAGANTAVFDLSGTCQAQ